MERTPTPSTERGTKDGSGAADHDEPYQFGRRPRAVAPWPFTERQYARMLVMRGRFGEQTDPADRASDSAVAVLTPRKTRRKAA